MDKLMNNEIKDYPTGKCKLCNKTLVKFGSSRKNGKEHQDWIKRKLHKKCYKTYNAYEDWKRRNHLPDIII